MDKAKNGKEERLTTWGEIACYLGISVRTAQEWNRQKKLPVHRIPESKRPTVVAYKSEIEEWLTGTGAGDKSGSDPRRRRYFIWSLPVLAIFLLLISAGRWFAASEPYDCMFGQGGVSVVDSSGSVLWIEKIPRIRLGHYQQQAMVGKALHLVEDLNGDEKNEVCFIIAAQGQRSSLVCYDRDHKRIWEFDYGKELTFGGERLGDNFTGTALQSVQVGKKKYILTIACHSPRFPSQVALLDAMDGSLAGEYFHPGYFYRYWLSDVDGDGTNELLLGGINNPGPGIGHAVLSVLDLPFLTSSHLDFFGNPGPRELAYLVFPRTELDRSTGGKTAADTFIAGTDTMTIRVSGGFGDFYYVLNREFRPVDFIPSDALIQSYRKERGSLADTSSITNELGRFLTMDTAPDGNSPLIERLFREAPVCDGSSELPCLQRIEAK